MRTAGGLCRWIRGLATGERRWSVCQRCWNGCVERLKSSHVRNFNSQVYILHFPRAGILSGRDRISPVRCVRGAVETRKREALFFHGDRRGVRTSVSVMVFRFFTKGSGQARAYTVYTRSEVHAVRDQLVPATSTTAVLTRCIRLRRGLAEPT